MVERIIAAVDAREQSRDAIELAVELATALPAELDVAAVLDYSPLPIDVEPYEVVLRDHFARIFGLVEEQKPGLRYTPQHLTGPSPPRSLSDLAEKREAALIVLGSTHRGPIGRVLPGSVGERLLSGGPCPVAIAPRGYGDREHRLVRIGVGYDGREESVVALDYAGELAARLGARLRLIGVNPPPSSTLEEVAAPLGYEEAAREQLASALKEGAATVADAEVETSLLDGGPAAVLADESAGLDLLVVGSRGYGPIRRLLLGDVASPLTRQARCPLIVVPRGWAGRASDAAAT